MAITASAIAFGDSLAADLRLRDSVAGDIDDALGTVRASHSGARRDWGAVSHLEKARVTAERAARNAVPETKRELAIEAAAHAIFAIELLDGEAGR